MSHLINISLLDGVFPDKLKMSIVKPLHKQDSSFNLTNYRPITLISMFSKVYEKVMHRWLHELLNKFNIIKNEQNCFQKGKSTTLAA